MVFYSIGSITKMMETKAVDPSTVTKLYFDSSSSYPRFKIKDTNYQRVIKVPKCEAAVIPDKIPYIPGTGEYYIYKWSPKQDTDDGAIIYCVCPDLFKKRDLSIYNAVCSYGVDFMDGLKTINQIPKNSILIYQGNVCITEEPYVETIKNLMEVYPGYITEGTLDGIVNKTLESINEETVLSLNDMLSSTDVTVVELGLKILQSLNVTEKPLTMRALLYANISNIKDNKAAYTTGVQQVLKSLNLELRRVPGNVPFSLGEMLNYEWNKATEEDRALTAILTKVVTESYFANLGRQVANALKVLPFSIKTYVN